MSVAQPQKPVSVHNVTTVPTRKIKQVARYIPDSFVGALSLPLSPATNKHVVRMHKAAILMHADYILHYSLELGGQYIQWLPVSGLVILRHRPHALSMGWPINAGDPPTKFGEAEWFAGFEWLLQAGYLTSNLKASVFDLEASYMPTLGLVVEFFKTQNIALALAK